MSWQEVLAVLAVSAAPISELRGGIPLALTLGFAPEVAVLLALLGNLFPLPFLLWGLPRALPWLESLPGGLGRAVRTYFSWRRRRAAGLARYGPWFLFFFVAVPFPGTGLWTGAILAALLGIPARKAAGPLAAGVGVAGLLVLLGSLGVLRLFGG
ncbi:MAG: COG2426 family protein [Candidatus Bipolaricaulaceae bacterium]